jgi:hypothetical protein
MVAKSSPKKRLGLSAGCASTPVSGLSALILGTAANHPDHPVVVELAKSIPIEAIKGLPTRPDTLADTLRLLLTEKDLLDVEAAIPALIESVRRTGSKSSASRVREVLKQLLAEAGI